jgi:hypothetical protein
MISLYFVILAVEPFREFYEQEFLLAPAYVLIVAVVVAWAIGLRWFWRWNLPGQSRRLWRYLTADLR